jgi:serine/threonine protein kinase
VASDDSTVTVETAVMGTPMYMPPEAIKNPEATDGRSDLYSLGAVGYYLLTGEDVFEGANAVEICSHHLHSEPAPPSERTGTVVPQPLDQLLLKCLEKEPDDRPQSARDMLQLLNACDCEREWTEERAVAWWAEHDGLTSLTHAKSVSGSNTIAVDLDHRRAQ